MTDKRKPGGNRAEEITIEENFSTDQAFRDDCDWFTLNPNRSHRLREPFPNEMDFEAGYPYAYVVVRQSAPGDRERMFYMTEERFPQFVLFDEHFAHALFDACGQAVMYGVVSKQLEILHQASLLREGFEVMQ